MPAANGQYFFEDYVTELKARGFDGFSDADLKTYINRGYFHIARKYPHFWKQTTDTFTVAVGAYSVQLGTELPNFHHIEGVFRQDDPRTKLKPMAEDQFYEQWYPLDLTSAARRAKTSHYFIDGTTMYLLPAPEADTDFIARYSRRPTALVNPTDLPITPVHLDEAILTAALIRCHKRANEPGLAALAESDLQEFFDDMLDDDEMMGMEFQDRVRPDNTWL